MPNTQEFGIIDNIKEQAEYITYEPEKYNSIFIDDDFFTSIYMKNLKQFNEIETYFCSLDNPNIGLALEGITLIPPKSLENFLNIISRENDKSNSKELLLLIEKISFAIKENKYLIHFGL